jgi:hypothetical protein
VKPVVQEALPLGFLRRRLRRAYSPYAGRVGSGSVIASYNIDREETNCENNQQATPQQAHARARKIIFWPRHLELVALSRRIIQYRRLPGDLPGCELVLSLFRFDAPIGYQVA